MKTKPLIKTLAILLIAFSVFLAVVYSQQYSQRVQDIINQIGGPVDQEWDENAASGRYSACCVNVDGYCLDMFESENHPCGSNMDLSEDFCGNVPECQKHCCFIDNVKQKTLMNMFECEKLGKDTNTTNVNWDSSCVI